MTIMMKSRTFLLALLPMLCVISPAPADEGESAGEEVECRMKFNLKGWSVFYKKANGNGVIDCDNGQTATVSLKIRGGGLTFGKSEIEDGTGNFSDVADISELFGAYAHAEAHAGASGSSSATVLTKGEVQLALAGTGKGWNLGVDFGKFTITPQ